MSDKRTAYIDVSDSAVILNPNEYAPQTESDYPNNYSQNNFPLRIYDGKNYLPTKVGVRSFFGTSSVQDQSGLEDVVESPIQEVFVFQKQDYTNVTMILADNGIWTTAATAGEDGDSDTVTYTHILTIDTSDLDEDESPMWTIATMGKLLMMYRQGSSSIYVIEDIIDGEGVLMDGMSGMTNPPTVTGVETLSIQIFEFIPTYLNIEGQIGIFRAGSSLGMWDSDQTISYSAVNDYTDFEPDVDTLADSVTLSYQNGIITTIKPHGKGFIVYSTNSVIYVVETTDTTDRFVATPIFTDAGVLYPRQVAVAQPSTIHFAWTTSGLYQITSGSPSVTIAETYDYLQEMNAPVYLQIVNNRYLCLLIIPENFIPGHRETSSATGEGTVLSYPGVYSPGITVDGIHIDGRDVCFNVTNDDESTVKPWIAVNLYTMWHYSGATVTMESVDVPNSDGTSTITVARIVKGQYDYSRDLAPTTFEPGDVQTSLYDAMLTNYIHIQGDTYDSKYDFTGMSTYDEAFGTGETTNTGLTFGSTQEATLTNYLYDTPSNNIIIDTDGDDDDSLGITGDDFIDKASDDWAPYASTALGGSSSADVGICSEYDTPAEVLAAVNLLDNELEDCYVLPKGGDADNLLASDEIDDLELLSTGIYKLQPEAAELYSIEQRSIEDITLLYSLDEDDEDSVGYIISTLDSDLEDSSMSITRTVHDLYDYTLSGRINNITISADDATTMSLSDIADEIATPSGVDEFSIDTDSEIIFFSQDLADDTIVDSSERQVFTDYDSYDSELKSRDEAAYNVVINAFNTAVTTMNSAVEEVTDSLDALVGETINGKTISDISYNASSFTEEDEYDADSSTATSILHIALYQMYDYTQGVRIAYLDTLVPIYTAKGVTVTKVSSSDAGLELLYGPNIVTPTDTTIEMERNRADELPGNVAADRVFFNINNDTDALDETVLITAANQEDVPLGMTTDEAAASDEYDYTADAIRLNTVYPYYGSSLYGDTYFDNVTYEQGMICGHSDPIDIPAIYIDPISADPWEIDVLGSTYVLANGQIAPYDPTFNGMFVYDTQLSKWGEMEGAFKAIVDMLPYGSTGGAAYPVYDGGMKAGIITEDGTLPVFTHETTDSFVRYGKFRRMSAKQTRLQEVEVGFKDYSSGAVIANASLDGRSPEYGYSEALLYENKLSAILKCDIIGEWHAITIAGKYDITKLNLTSKLSGNYKR